jgi:hypothetical protein
VFGGLNGAEAHNKFQTITMLTDPGWYKTMFNRISVGILGGKVGSLLFLLGLFAAVRSKKGGLVSAYLIAVLCYFGLVAEGQIDAPYRQLISFRRYVLVAPGTKRAGQLLLNRADWSLTPRIPAWVHCSVAPRFGLFHPQRDSPLERLNALMSLIMERVQRLGGSARNS